MAFYDKEGTVLKVFLNAVKCNLTELATRSTNFTFAVSSLLDMRMCQDSSCSWSIARWSSFVGILVHVFLSVGIPWRLCPLPCPSLSFHCLISVTGACFLPPRGGSWLGCLDMPFPSGSWLPIVEPPGCLMHPTSTSRGSC